MLTWRSSTSSISTTCRASRSRSRMSSRLDWTPSSLVWRRPTDACSSISWLNSRSCCTSRGFVRRCSSSSRRCSRFSFISWTSHILRSISSFFFDEKVRSAWSRTRSISLRFFKITSRFNRWLSSSRSRCSSMVRSVCSRFFSICASRRRSSSSERWWSSLRCRLSSRRRSLSMSSRCSSSSLADSCSFRRASSSMRFLSSISRRCASSSRCRCFAAISRSRSRSAFRRFSSSASCDSVPPIVPPMSPPPDMELPERYESWAMLWCAGRIVCGMSTTGGVGGLYDDMYADPSERSSSPHVILSSSVLHPPHCPLVSP
mmetsp:Transcript_38729/g.91425  ORF Transcript_38729/g.91425 Transcript_38729/m.91425 type:complete len:317 (+) Transcript_38729:553-1503(+)